MTASNASAQSQNEQTALTNPNLTLFLEQLQSQPSLAAEPELVPQQLKLALYGLGRFTQSAIHYRNQLLNRALDPALIPDTDNVIDMGEFDSQPVVIKYVDIGSSAIAGWDFSLITAANTGKAESKKTPLFDPEFVERTLYLLGELIQPDAETVPHLALLAVDRLDLLLTLAKAEIKRLASELQKN